MAFQILVVDDSPAMRQFIRRVLDLSGLDAARYLEASNGRCALDVLSKEWVDVVLTDINMPEMDGEELVRRMEKDELLRSIPVLVISTDASGHRIATMMGLGAKGYVKKPFLPETLRKEVERVMGVENAGA